MELWLCFFALLDLDCIEQRNDQRYSPSIIELRGLFLGA